MNFDLVKFMAWKPTAADNARALAEWRLILLAGL